MLILMLVCSAETPIIDFQKRVQRVPVFKNIFWILLTFFWDSECSIFGKNNNTFKNLCKVTKKKNGRGVSRHGR